MWSFRCNILLFTRSVHSVLFCLFSGAPNIYLLPDFCIWFIIEGRVRGNAIPAVPLVDQNNLFGTGSPGFRIQDFLKRELKPVSFTALWVWRYQPVVAQLDTEVARLDTELLRVLLSREHGAALRTLSLLSITFSWNSGESRRGRSHL